MLDAIQQFIASFSLVSSQAAGNWAEEFARNRLIPLLEHLPFVPAGVAEHFPVSLGTILVMFGACGVFAAIVPLIPLVLVLAERKVSAQIQNRTGPMRVGPWGTLQTLADGVKLIFKEDFVPPQGDKLLFVLAPYIIFACSFAAFAAIPFGQGILIRRPEYRHLLYYGDFLRGCDGRHYGGLVVQQQMVAFGRAPIRRANRELRNPAGAFHSGCCDAGSESENAGHRRQSIRRTV